MRILLLLFLSSLAQASYLPIQNYRGQMRLGAGATTGTNVLLSIKDGHIKTASTTPPTVAVSGNAGTGGSCSISNASDVAGKITVVTGTIGISTGAYCVVSFDKPYGVAPICILTPASSTLSTSVYVTSTVNDLTINFAVAGGITSTYVENYFCVETQ